jgi:transposase
MSKTFFINPDDPMQKRYEALRASFVDGLSAAEVAKLFGYSVHTINALRRDFKADALPPFFRSLTKGPKHRRPSTLLAKDRIIELRKQNYSIEEIEEVLLRERYDVTAKTIGQVLKDEGFARLFRRTHAERRIALQQAKDPAEISHVKQFSAHEFVKTAYVLIFEQFYPHYPRLFYL